MVNEQQQTPTHTIGALDEREFAFRPEIFTDLKVLAELDVIADVAPQCPAAMVEAFAWYCVAFLGDKEAAAMWIEEGPEDATTRPLERKDYDAHNFMDALRDHDLIEETAWHFNESELLPILALIVYAGGFAETLEERLALATKWAEVCALESDDDRYSIAPCGRSDHLTREDRVRIASLPENVKELAQHGLKLVEIERSA